MNRQNFIFLFLFLTYSLSAQTIQNLVPNPSFERLINLPVKPNKKNVFEYEPASGFIPYQINLFAWFAATKTTPDLRINSPAHYNECKRKFKNCDKARTGVNCVGIITSMANGRTKTYREYVQIKLKKNLRPNELTHVEFWVAKERQAKLVSNNIGCHFSMKKVTKDTKEVLDLKPQINQDTIINTDKKQWIKITGSFIPDKPFKYLLIGNFFDNKNTKTESFKKYNGSPYSPPYAYYLLDDIKVWQDIEKEDILIFKDKPIAENTAIELKHVEFEFDKSDLIDSSFNELNKLLLFLNNNPTVNIKIQGHTDSFGTPLYNQKLSEARAKRVYRYLIDKGVNKDRLSYQGFGESKPIKENKTDELRRRNRRVEFVIVQR